MSIFVSIYNGKVSEVFPPTARADDSPDGVEPAWKSGDDIPIEIRFTPEFVADLIDVTDISPQPTEGWLYDGTSFSKPVGTV